jgi:hypothetical protein
VPVVGIPSFIPIEEQTMSNRYRLTQVAVGAALALAGQLASAQLTPALTLLSSALSKSANGGGVALPAGVPVPIDARNFACPGPGSCVINMESMVEIRFPNGVPFSNWRICYLLNGVQLTPCLNQGNQPDVSQRHVGHARAFAMELPPGNFAVQTVVTVNGGANLGGWETDYHLYQ